MPTYEYVCTSCQNQWEEIQKISDSPLETCPKCQKSTARRQISGGNFILKGGGWYADLYSSSGSKKSSDASTSSTTPSSGSDSSASSGSSTTTSETKPSKPSTPPAKSD